MTMTNNPTIDGVSLLPCPFCGGDAVLKQYRADGLEIRCTGCQSMRQQRWMGKGRGWLETKMIEKWNERTSRAVECQEPVVLLSEHRTGLAAYLEQIKGQQSTIARLEARITQLESEKEFAAATYQAARDRIAELESGRGDPVAWQYRVSAGPATGWSLWHDGKGDEFRNSYQVENRPLFTAPPTPVAVAMSFEFEHPSSKEKRTVTLTKRDVFDGMEDYFYDKLGEQICQCESVGETNVVDCTCDEYVHDFEIVNACLDATAALNKSP